MKKKSKKTKYTKPKPIRDVLFKLAADLDKQAAAYLATPAFFTPRPDDMDDVTWERRLIEQRAQAATWSFGNALQHAARMARERAR